MEALSGEPGVAGEDYTYDDEDDDDMDDDDDDDDDAPAAAQWQPVQRPVRPPRTAMSPVSDMIEMSSLLLNIVPGCRGTVGSSDSAAIPPPPAPTDPRLSSADATPARSNTR